MNLHLKVAYASSPTIVMWLWESWENDSGLVPCFFLTFVTFKTLWPQLHNCWEISCCFCATLSGHRRGQILPSGWSFHSGKGWISNLKLKNSKKISQSNYRLLWVRLGLLKFSSNHFQCAHVCYCATPFYKNTVCYLNFIMTWAYQKMGDTEYFLLRPNFLCTIKTWKVGSHCFLSRISLFVNHLMITLELKTRTMCKFIYTLLSKFSVKLIAIL